jgi:hypothetical protein
VFSSCEVGVKSYRRFPELLAEFDSALAATSRVGTRLRPSPQVQHAHFGPLPAALEVLLEGRHYARLELVLKLDDVRTAEIAVGAEGSARPALTIPVRVGGHDFGELRVFVATPDRFGPEDRVFLQQVARRLAVFLGEKGRYVLTRLRLQGARGASVVTFPAKSTSVKSAAAHPAARASGS